MRNPASEIICRSIGHICARHAGEANLRKHACFTYLFLSKACVAGSNRVAAANFLVNISRNRCIFWSRRFRFLPQSPHSYFDVTLGGTTTLRHHRKTNRSTGHTAQIGGSTRRLTPTLNAGTRNVSQHQLYVSRCETKCNECKRPFWNKLISGVTIKDGNLAVLTGRAF